MEEESRTGKKREKKRKKQKEVEESDRRKSREKEGREEKGRKEKSPSLFFIAARFLTPAEVYYQREFKTNWLL